MQTAEINLARRDPELTQPSVKKANYLCCLVAFNKVGYCTAH